MSELEDKIIKFKGKKYIPDYAFATNCLFFAENSDISVIKDIYS